MAAIESICWLRATCPPDTATEVALRQALARLGLELRHLENDDPAPTGALGVLLCAAVTDEDIRWMAEAHRRGARYVAVLVPSAGDPAPSAEDRWRLLAAGAGDLLAWAEIRAPERRVAARLERWREIDRLATSPRVTDELVGNGPALRAVVRRLVEIARFAGGPVLLTGETGTGKELAARLLHRLDPRRKGELTVLDCTTLTPELAGSELFGHERGAFTHAVAAREGAFARADGGTLFLDEVGELPLPLQAELLRSLQEKTYKRVGGNTWKKSDFRLVCATHRDLAAAVEAGTFRQDLYHRVTSWTCRMPSLAERPEDVPELVLHFLREAGCGESVRLDPALAEWLGRRPYPGNVRELRHLAERLAALHVGGELLTLGDLPAQDRPDDLPELADWRDEGFWRAVRRAVHGRVGLKEIGGAAADAAVEVAVAEADGRLADAAELLGVTPRALQMRRRRDG